MIAPVLPYELEDLIFQVLSLRNLQYGFVRTCWLEGVMCEGT